MLNFLYKTQINSSENKKCLYCGDEILNKGRKYCSMICGIYKWRKDNPKRFSLITSKWCKKDYSENPLKYSKINRKNYDKNKENIKKKIINRQKETNYSSEKTKKQRFIRSIKRSTRYYFPLNGKKCEFCSKNATERHHNTDPIKFDKFNFVCHGCHLKQPKNIERGFK